MEYPKDNFQDDLTHYPYTFKVRIAKHNADKYKEYLSEEHYAALMDDENKSIFLECIDDSNGKIELIGSS